MMICLKLHGRFDEIHGYAAPAESSPINGRFRISWPSNPFKCGKLLWWLDAFKLARTLMSRSDLLLLDEPTNHFGLRRHLVALEDWLKAYEGTLVLISHDRDFLDVITDHILHIENQELTYIQATSPPLKRHVANAWHNSNRLLKTTGNTCASTKIYWSL